MLWTARNAELLKQEAGIRAGGRATENPVKHLSLNWAPDENPTREHMIETAEDFLRHMKWQEHQALIVAHEDKHMRMCMSCSMSCIPKPGCGSTMISNAAARRHGRWTMKGSRGGFIASSGCKMSRSARMRRRARPGWHLRKISENSKMKKKPCASRARRAGPGCLNRSPRKLSGSLPGYSGCGALRRLCRRRDRPRSEIDLAWRASVKRRMRSSLVVERQITGDRGSRLADAAVSAQIDLLVFHAAP